MSKKCPQCGFPMFYIFPERREIFKCNHCGYKTLSDQELAHELIQIKKSKELLQNIPDRKEGRAVIFNFLNFYIFYPDIKSI